MKNLTIFYNQKKILLTNNVDAGEIYMSEKLLQFLESETGADLCFYFEDISGGLEEIKTHFKYIKAAGGLVYNAKSELLVIQRLGVPDLPKGKMEKGETPEQSALREVEEECGVSDLEIVEAVESSYHIYSFKNRFVLKKTYWFTMKYRGEEELVPQTEEDITDVFWSEESRRKELADKTYASLRPYFLR